MLVASAQLKAATGVPWDTGDFSSALRPRHRNGCPGAVQRTLGSCPIEGPLKAGGKCGTLEAGRRIGSAASRCTGQTDGGQSWVGLSQSDALESNIRAGFSVRPEKVSHAGVCRLASKGAKKASNRPHRLAKRRCKHSGSSPGKGQPPPRCSPAGARSHLPRTGSWEPILGRWISRLGPQSRGGPRFRRPVGWSGAGAPAGG